MPIPNRPAAPSISILLVNYNGFKHLDDCLSSIFSQISADFEVVMVDNGSRDGSVEFVRSNYPGVRIVESGSNLGFAKGNNLGVAHCQGVHIFFLNNDTRLEPGTLRAIQEAVSKYPPPVIMACMLLKFDDPERADSAGDTVYRGGFVANFSNYPSALFRESREVLSACAGAAIYPKSLFLNLGGFDEDFFLIFEDMDLSLRARHKGVTIRLVPSARVRHKGSATIGGFSSPLALYYGNRNYLLFLVKNFPSWTLFKCLPGITFTLGANLLNAIRFRRLGVFSRSLFDFLGMLPPTLRKRRATLKTSLLSRPEFEKLLRPNWLSERLDFRRKNFDSFAP